ncbi:glycosyltransferase [Subtercola lobariae]|uniref:Glycosyl transferase family 1 domain-containing protein n=1 Tax=Subtercola lobariae TaxID=1588641 RepID=A0A917EVZ5_9MICO|nr:glycosyltransferase [Subtercola lobariae]GGF14121.1 hypothetical protein GCM10011399_04990 [Subtercola lobariae]
MSDNLNTHLNLVTIVTQFGGSAEGRGDTQLIGELARLLDADAAWPRLWLTWATLRGELPLEHDLIEFSRHLRLSGAAPAIAAINRRHDLTVFGYAGTVEIVSNAVIVDVHHTAQTDAISGIQRVVRETVGRWKQNHDVVLVAWTHDHRALRRLTEAESARIRPTSSGDGIVLSSTEHDAESSRSARAMPIFVPNGGALIVPELAADSGRAERLLALSRFSGIPTSYIVHDRVPVTSGETTPAPIAAQFPLYLDALAYSGTLAANSASTAREFESWRKTLAASGRTSPNIITVPLGGETVRITDDEHDAAGENLLVGEVTLSLTDPPMVLVVGSHEPRKNHLQVLHAARSLWVRGVDFQLVFVGGAGWNSGEFDHLAVSLKSDGHPLTIVKVATDELLSRVYRHAVVSVFTSLHEGFGLPIVESLRAGTPVITSAVGSMQELADTYSGVVTVDPRSDEALEEVLFGLLTEPDRLAELTTALDSNVYVTWDEYAERTWHELV